MIRAHFGLEKDPFSKSDIQLIEQQLEIFDILKIHSRQGGLCVLIGDPGVGKSSIKQKLTELGKAKDTEVITMGRTMHTYLNIVKQLQEAFQLEEKHIVKNIESDIIQNAFKLNSQGKIIITIIDDAGHLKIECLRKLRLLFDEFPKNHNLVLLGETDLLQRLSLGVNEDIKSRITYSAKLNKLNPDDMKKFVISELERCGLPHPVFEEGAMEAIIRSSEGSVRLAKNLCLGSLVQAVVERTRTVNTQIVSTILSQPHWRNYEELLQS